MPEYTIVLADRQPPLHGDIEQPPWSLADVALVDQFPWYAGGLKQLTTARLLYDAGALYLQFICEDKHISSEVRELNGPVCRDSCAEFFATISPADGPGYFNFEANACGVFHLGFGPHIDDRKLISPGLARQIRVTTSLDAPAKDVSPDDDGWWLAAAIPFEVIGELSGRQVKPAAGDVWQGNFYRCGGTIDPQYACWSPVDTPRPHFHQPGFFDTLRFS